MTSSRRGRFARNYAKLVAVGLFVSAVIAGAGYFPTLKWAGADHIVAMITGCAVSWMASCFGAIPLARALSRPSADTATAILTSTMIRFIVVLALVAPLTLSGWFDRIVFVVWVAISYLLLLAVDTCYAVRLMKRES